MKGNDFDLTVRNGSDYISYRKTNFTNVGQRVNARIQRTTIKSWFAILIIITLFCLETTDCSFEISTSFWLSRCSFERARSSANLHLDSARSSCSCSWRTWSGSLDSAAGLSYIIDINEGTRLMQTCSTSSITATLRTKSNTSLYN